MKIELLEASKVGREYQLEVKFSPGLIARAFGGKQIRVRTYLSCGGLLINAGRRAAFRDVATGNNVSSALEALFSDWARLAAKKEVCCE